MTVERAVGYDELPGGSGADAPERTGVMKDYYERYWTPDARMPEHSALLAERLNLLSACLKTGRVGHALEVGCGRGEVVAHLRDAGIDAVGMDISETAVRLASGRHPGCRFVCHPVETRPWPGGVAAHDLVVSFEVIEHLLEPRDLLAGACEALRSGGFLALTTPFHGLAKNLVLAMRGFDRHFQVNGPHIRFFSDGALARMLDETGFDIVRVRHFGRFPPLSAGVFVWARKR